LVEAVAPEPQQEAAVAAEVQHDPVLPERLAVGVAGAAAGCPQPKLA